VIASSGGLTIHFKSDPSVTGTGWVANWLVFVSQPALPIFDPIPNPPCSSSTLTLHVDQPIRCDSLDASDVRILGPQGQTITTLTPIGCVGGLTQDFSINFSPGLNTNGNYTVRLQTFFVDACDSLIEQTVFATFTVNDCPLSVQAFADDTVICIGDCTDISAQAFGGDPGTYNFTWSNGVPNGPGPHTVCPNTTTTYTVTVTDATPAPAATATITVVVNQLPTMPANFTVCQTDPAQFLTATPPGGYWTGQGITDTATGRFYPNSAGPGVKTITYHVNGCTNTFDISVTPADAGGTYASCPGLPPFQLTGFNPPGGTWSGPNITPTGVFDPATPGSYVVTYTPPNGCPPDNRRINVDTIVIQDDDTICTNNGEYSPSFSPQGGRWTASGPGLTSSYWGRFDPDVSGPGTFTMTYTINGCVKTYNLTVLAIDAGPNLTSCPAQDSFIMVNGSPAGGYWTGDGIIDSVNGIFQPSWPGFPTQTPTVYLTYNLAGCADDMIMYVRKTEIRIDPLPSTCPADSTVLLVWDNTQRTPYGGFWTGPGILNPGLHPNGQFNAETAGPGVHKLYYTMNECTDSTNITVFEPAIVADTTVCETQSPFNIPSSPPGGNWFSSSAGLLDPSTGLFSAPAAGVGSHVLRYVSADGCPDTMTATVDPLPTVTIQGLDPNYCFKDTTVNLQFNPPGGVITGPVFNGNQFNPAQAGAGNHTIRYTVGAGDCAVTSTVTTFVEDPIQVTVPFNDTIICSGDLVRLYGDASGGLPANYNYSWTQGLGNGTQHLVSPGATTIYRVKVEDGCSDADSTSIIVQVTPAFSLSFDTSDAVCFGEPGWAEVTITPAGSYRINWDDNPSTTTARIQGEAGRFYSVTVVETSSGCTQTGSLQIPSFPRVDADFLATPADGCVDLLDPTFEFINQSEGADTGVWFFGDGTFAPYDPFGNPSHTFPDTGTFTVYLKIWNEIGCESSQVLEVCVDPATVIHIPNAFTPDGDGINDFWLPVGIGLSDYELIIYNRWGESIFHTNDPDQGWDGNYDYEPAPMGGYAYKIIFRKAATGVKESRSGMLILVR
jgi:gliding motility-associated-like protein